MTSHEDDDWMEGEDGQHVYFKSNARRVIEAYAQRGKCWRIADSSCKQYERYIFKDYRSYYNVLSTMKDFENGSAWGFLTGLPIERITLYLAAYDDRFNVANPAKVLLQMELGTLRDSRVR